MNNINIIILLGIIVIPGILIAILITRLNRNQWHHFQERHGKEMEYGSGLRNPMETSVKVIAKSETYVPNSGNFVKVDLRVEVLLPRIAPYQVSTCWLVKKDSVDLVMPGNDVPVIMDPKKPLRIFPNVPWAKPWIFGK